MTPFEYVTPRSLRELPELLVDGRAVVLAGGTDLLDRLKERLDRPERVVNLKGLRELQGIDASAGLDIGALARIAEVAADRRVQAGYRVLAEAAASIATPQLRNMGTLGGNLCQRPRCWYFRDAQYSCLKKGGHTCFAADGRNRYHAVFGRGPCYIVHPSDAAPALVALGASLDIEGSRGPRQVPVADFFRLPHQSLWQENMLETGEVVSRIRVPEPARGTRSTYLKFREKQSLDFAVSSVAAVLQMEGGQVRQARVVLGGVAPVPWRAERAEAALAGRALTPEVMQAAAEAAVAGAEPLSENAYKIELTRNLVRRALQSLATA
ncbi:MAG: xanthine dehydrogenase family protein subunit M [Gemmatimonadota bacterium]